MHDLSIRPLASSDAEALADLVTQLGYPTGAGQMARRMEFLARESRTHALVAESEGRIVGTIAVTFHRGYEFDGFLGEVINLVVDESSRGRGIGKRLMQAGNNGSARGARDGSRSTHLSAALTHTVFTSEWATSRPACAS